MKTLVIAEKPSVARDIAAALPEDFQTRDGFLEGKTADITWCFGHLVQQMNPDAVDEKWKRWSIDTLPILPAVIPLAPVESGKKQLGVVAGLMKSDQYKRVVNATDAGREGEAIFRCICRFVTGKMDESTPSLKGKELARMWCSDPTKEAILKAYESVKPDSALHGLAEAAFSRAHADWIVGMTFSRFMSCATDDRITVGRVQSPCVRLLADRQAENQAHTVQLYYVPAIKAADVLMEWQAPKDAEAMYDKAVAQALLDANKADSGTVASAIRKEESVKPPLLFDLNSLQIECNGSFGFSAKETLEIAQALYERRKILTYPRTDSKYISDDLFANIPDLLGSFPAEYAEFSDMAKAHLGTGHKPEVVDNSKLTDHHAIIPTRQAVPADLTQQERQVYDLVVRRTIAAFSPAAVYEMHRIKVQVGELVFAPKDSGCKLVSAGWHSVAASMREERTMPDLSEGQPIPIDEMFLEERKTKPRPIFTESSFLKEMEKLGLGTPATRAAIIERIIEVGMVNREKRQLLVTDKGMQTVSILKAHLGEVCDPDFTAQWEAKLADIEKGKLTRQDFLKELEGFIASKIEALKSVSLGYEKKAPEGVAACPACGVGSLMDRKTFFGCSEYGNPERKCGFSLPKTWGGKPMSAAMVKALCSNKRKTGMQSFTSAKGAKYKAALVLTIEEGGKGKITPAFEEAKGA